MLTTLLGFESTGLENLEEVPYELNWRILKDLTKASNAVQTPQPPSVVL